MGEKHFRIGTLAPSARPRAALLGRVPHPSVLSSLLSSLLSLLSSLLCSAYRQAQNQLARFTPRREAGVKVGVALEGRAAQQLRRKLHPLPLLHAVGLGGEPQEGAAVVLDGCERSARRLPSEEDDAPLLRQLDAVDDLAVGVDHLEQLRVLRLCDGKGEAA